MPEQMTKQDAIEYLLYMKHDVQAKSPMDIALDTAIEALKQPTIEAEPVRHGRWIEVKHIPAGDTMYCDCKCSSCNFQITREKGKYPRFCENCGARMNATDTNDGGKVGDDNAGRK